jgi:hypothetical protein
MAHFAELDENNIVTSVIVVNNDVLIVDGEESENAGIDFLESISGHRNWKQTSYNNSFRKNYAGRGYKYDKDFDVFIEPRPYESWKMNYNTMSWEAPVPMPEYQTTDTFRWVWSEYNQEWIKVNI